MGAGVSLSLSRDGVHGESILSSISSLISDPFPWEYDFYVVSVPCSREPGFSGGFSLPEFQTIEGDSLWVSLVWSANHLSSVVPVTKVQVRSVEAVHAQASRIDDITPWIRDMGLQGGGLNQKWVSPSPQKGKIDVGFFLSSRNRWVAIAGSDLPKEESNRALNTVVISVITVGKSRSQLLDMPEFREAKDAYALVHILLHVAVGTTHRADPQVTSMSEFVPGRSRGERRSSIIGRGFEELVSPFFPSGNGKGIDSKARLTATTGVSMPTTPFGYAGSRSFDLIVGNSGSRISEMLFLSVEDYYGRLLVCFEVNGVYGGLGFEITQDEYWYPDLYNRSPATKMNGVQTSMMYGLSGVNTDWVQNPILDLLFRVVGSGFGYGSRLILVLPSIGAGFSLDERSCQICISSDFCSKLPRSD